MKKIILTAVAITFAFASFVQAEAIKFAGVVEKIAGETVIIKNNETGKSLTLTVKDPAIIQKFTSKKIDTGDTVHVKYESTTNVVSRLTKPGC